MKAKQALWVRRSESHTMNVNKQLLLQHLNYPQHHQQLAWSQIGEGKKATQEKISKWKIIEFSAIFFYGNDFGQTH